MRLIDADKLYPDRMTKEGLAISQSQIANAPTINPKEFEPLINKLVDVLPDLVNAAIQHIPEYIAAKIAAQDPNTVNTHKDTHAAYWDNLGSSCPFDDNTNCIYYPDGCGKCTYNNP